MVALAALLSVLLGEVAVLAPIAYGLHLVWPAWGAVLPFLVWWGFGLLQLAPAAQRSLARISYGGREPIAAERLRLELPWRSLQHRAGVRTGHHRLMVIESNELNACTPIGRILTVTSHSARTLSGIELEAVLAHELGHQAGWRAVPAFVNVHLSLPSRALRHMLRALWSPVGPAWKRAVAWHRPIGFLLAFLLAAFAAAVTIVAALPAALAYAASALARLADGPAEARADAFGVRLGLGNELLAVVEHRIEEGRRTEDSEAPPGLPLHLVQRAQRLRRLLAAQTR